MTRYLPCLLALFSLVATAQEHAAHEHGAARLDVAIDGGTVTLMLESSMDSLAGFEHHASSEKDKTTLKTLREKLNDAGKIFVLSSAADCRLQSAKVESPLFEETGAAHEDHDEHHAEKSQDEKHHEDADKHEHERETHSDLEGEFVFQCSAPDKLEALTVNLFDIAANLQDLDVSVAGPRGQKGAELGSRQRTMAF